MSNWECSVCGYLHKEPAPPEKCPVCDAPAKMFEEVQEAPPAAAQPTAQQEVQQEVPSAVQPEVPSVAQPEDPSAAQPAASAERRWRCTVCGYVHTGSEPPETCPVCDAPKKMFVEIDADGKALGEPEGKTADTSAPIFPETTEKTADSLFDRFVKLSLKHHLHPMTVHFPNGILPAAVLFLVLAVIFNIATLEVAAYFNLIFVLLMLPMVLLTGYVEWQKRYRGAWTAIFITKIACSLIILGLVNVLVFWRFLDPTVVAAGSPFRLVYLGLAAAMLATVGLAGHLGGKLLYGSRGD